MAKLTRFQLTVAASPPGLCPTRRLAAIALCLVTLSTAPVAIGAAIAETETDDDGKVEAAPAASSDQESVSESKAAVSVKKANAGGEFPPEVPDAKAANAFRQYWQAFESYETKLLHEGYTQYKKQWDEVRQSFVRDRVKITAAQIEALKRSAAKYRQHLTQHPQADNRPFVMLDLAQIYSLIGDHAAKSDAEGAAQYRQEALGVLRDLDDRYKNFVYKEQALYLRAALLEALNRDDDALASWQVLANAAKSTLYGVHARVAVGDHMFKRERPREAMTAYEKALALLPDVEINDPDYERLRINYRLAWAAYRAAELRTTVAAAMELLQPGSRIRSAEQRHKIQQDAVELIGDVLYEADSLPKAKEVLGRRDLHDFAGAVGLRTLKRYNGNGIHANAVDLGEYLAEELPMASEAPEILQITADSWQKLGKSPRRILALEKLAMLLPIDSLWRARHRDDPSSVQRMEERATAAAEAVAIAHYDSGMASGNAKEFLAASGFFDILLARHPNAASANSWRLRRAHSQYFAGNTTDAAHQYEDLKSGYKVDGETLQIASYQLVLANEKRWRDAFAKAGENGQDPYKDVETLTGLLAMEKSIDEFAARFPNQSRAVDLLLVAASANRDMERFDGASRYWQRVLVSQPAPAQRGIAMRGLIFAAMKTGSAGDVVELARRFLKLEDWRVLGLSLGNELRGVLSAATLDEGQRLNGMGNVHEAGQLLYQIATEFANLPERDRIFRDGAYLLAISGDWIQAQSAAEAYFKSGLQKNKGDMTYLLARAHEYQLRLHEAAVWYLDLGGKFPAHGRAESSLNRAEKLAVAEGDFALAAGAAATLAEQARRESDRLNHYTRAIDYANKAGDANRALSLARRRQRQSRSPAERLRSELLVASATAKAGAEQEAADSLVILAKDIDRNRGKLSAEDYASLVGEVHLRLGDEARRRFDDFRIMDRAGTTTANITEKTSHFEDLATHYDRAAAAGDPRWATEARYQLATAAEALADEIAAIPASNDEPVTLKAQSRYQAKIERLHAMARKYYSTNVLTARKDPARYRDNDWVKKSSLRLTGENSANPDAKHRDMLPVSMTAALPSQWSLK